MADDRYGSDDPGRTRQPDADECIRAGMYWFGRSDFVAAEAWWRRAVELDPSSSRAQECLRLLEKTSSTGFKSSSVADNPFASPVATRSPTIPPDTGGVSPVSPSPVPQGRSDSPLEAPIAPHWRSTTPVSDDPFEFVERGEQLYRTPSQVEARPGGRTTPWDEGPSRTSVVTVRSEADFDALDPDPTPLPTLDRERFFNRGDPQSREEIVDFLRATGDLPETAHVSSEAPTLANDIMFDDPVELAGAEPPPTPAEQLDRARDRFQLHDFVGALDILEALEESGAATDSARELASEARRNLVKMYESKIGDFNRAPRVIISGEEVIWLNLNHRAGFILSQIDGTVSYEDLIALSGMPRLDTLQILAELLSDRVIE